MTMNQDLPFYQKGEHDWICEEHPFFYWPHGDCAGPGMLASNLVRLIENSKVGTEFEANDFTEAFLNDDSGLMHRMVVGTEGEHHGLTVVVMLLNKSATVEEIE